MKRAAVAGLVIAVLLIASPTPAARVAERPESGEASAPASPASIVAEDPARETVPPEEPPAENPTDGPLAETTPGAPADLAVEDPGTGGTLRLMWSPGAEPDLAGYDLYRARGEEPFTKLNSQLIPGHRYEDANLVNGQIYVYRLRAVDLVGNHSAWSTEATGTPSDATPPNPPADLRAEDPGTGEILRLTWSPGAEPDLAGYDLYRSSGGEPFTRVNRELITDPKYEETHLVDGQRYVYRLRAVDVAGNYSFWSAEVTGIPTDVTPPDVPVGLEAFDPVTSDQLELRWDLGKEPDLAQYRLYRSRELAGQYTMIGLIEAERSWYRDEWLPLGVPHYYRITAVDRTGNESPPSDPVAGSPSAPSAVRLWHHGVKDEAGRHPGRLFVPRSVTRLPNENRLIADTFNRRVVEVNRGNQVVWEYGGLSEPVDARALPDGNILITDEQNHRVVMVHYQDKAVVWEYGTGEPGQGTGQLKTPTAAVPLTSGNILIVDAGNHRIIEVDREKRIVWQYGVSGVRGDGPGYLNAPGHVQVLLNGNVLVADTGNGRVVEIEKPSRSLVWQFGGLARPRGTARLRSGNTLIADTMNQRIIEVTAEGHIVWVYGGPNAGLLYEPRSVEELPGDGNLLVADQHNHWVVEIAH